MQIKIFSIPINDSGIMQEELNTFLRTHKILDITQQLYQNPLNAYWCLSIRYLDNFNSKTISQSKKIDYREVLDEAIFKKFSTL
ncbi:MAG: hypothetical protein QM539_07350 [Alphaproteobacteria bacterium]|nr:hypothetical protein [Alphaproteobacteria bacterium]